MSDGCPVCRSMKKPVVLAHDQTFTHRYVVHYPDHEPRRSDPYYRTFQAWKRAHKPGKCQFGLDRGGDFSECDLSAPLEAHHSHIELAMMNAVDFSLLEHTYPGISDPHTLGHWMNTTPNLVLLCRYHHRGSGGVHTASQSDYSAEHFIRHLIS